MVKENADVKEFKWITNNELNGVSDTVVGKVTRPLGKISYAYYDEMKLYVPAMHTQFCGYISAYFLKASYSVSNICIENSGIRLPYGGNNLDCPAGISGDIVAFYGKII